jgi:hypothetical protein
LHLLLSELFTRLVLSGGVRHYVGCDGAKRLETNQPGPRHVQLWCSISRNCCQRNWARAAANHVKEAQCDPERACPLSERGITNFIVDFVLDAGGSA